MKLYKPENEFKILKLEESGKGRARLKGLTLYIQHEPDENYDSRFIWDELKSEPYEAQVILDMEKYKIYEEAPLYSLHPVTNEKISFSEWCDLDHSVTGGRLNFCKKEPYDYEDIYTKAHTSGGYGTLKLLKNGIYKFDVVYLSTDASRGIVKEVKKLSQGTNSSHYHPEWWLKDLLLALSVCLGD